MPTPQEVIEKAKRDYMDAQKRGDKAAMDAAHRAAEQARRSAGISNDDPVYGNNPKTYRGPAARDDRPDRTPKPTSPQSGMPDWLNTGGQPGRYYTRPDGSVDYDKYVEYWKNQDYSFFDSRPDIRFGSRSILDDEGARRQYAAKYGDDELNSMLGYLRWARENPGMSNEDYPHWAQHKALLDRNRMRNIAKTLPDWSPDFADSYLRQRQQQQQQLLQLQDQLQRLTARDPWEGAMEQLMPYLFQLFGLGGFGGYSPYGYSYDPYGYGYSPYYGYPYF